VASSRPIVAQGRLTGSSIKQPQAVLRAIIGRPRLGHQEPQGQGGERNLAARPIKAACSQRRSGWIEAPMPIIVPTTPPKRVPKTTWISRPTWIAGKPHREQPPTRAGGIAVEFQSYLPMLVIRTASGACIDYEGVLCRAETSA
jgi:hypothetical protein